MIAKILKDNKRSIRAFVRAGFHLAKEDGNTKTYTITMEQFLEWLKGAAVMQKEIYITEVDRERLKRILSEALNSGKASEQAITKLEHEISKAVVVNPHQIPKDIITMNSRAVLHLDDEDMEVSLVYPEGPIEQRFPSILSPIGTAILGYAENDMSVAGSSGVMKFRSKRFCISPKQQVTHFDRVSQTLHFIKCNFIIS